MNKVIIIGRFTADPEVRYKDENAVAKFTLAVDRKKKDAGADFPRCVAFGKSAEFIEKYFKKGSKAVVEGRLQTGSYEDKDGKKVYTTDIIVESIEFGESKAASSDSKEAQKANPNAFMEITDDEINKLPFD